MNLTGQTGVVTRNPGWYGRLIQLFTGSPAFHCIYAVSETLCVSAETPTVRYRPISWFQGVEWTTIVMDPDEIAHGVHFARHQADTRKPYAYFDIVLLGIAAILKTHTPDWILDRVDSTDRWFCSELCDAAMIASGVNMFPGRPACAVTPKDFLDVVRGEAALPETTA